MSESLCSSVLTSTSRFLSSLPSSPVTISTSALLTELSENPQLYSKSQIPPNWHQWYHYYSHSMPNLSVEYIFVLDSLNFCFWPNSSYEYSNLASSLKFVLMKNCQSFRPENLMKLTEMELESWLQPLPKSIEEFFQSRENRDDFQLSEEEKKIFHSFQREEEKNVSRVEIPLLESRTIALRELGTAILKNYNGNFISLIESSHHSATHLVEIILSNFPHFRDSAVHEGILIHFYKRAQILVGDLWGAFHNQNLGQFFDIEKLTCFADYRIPQLLRQLGILKYSEELEIKVDSKQVLLAGSVEEMAIRAQTVQAVNLIREELKKRGVELLAVEVDWILWERGEAKLKELKPHHRTRTVFY